MIQIHNQSPFHQMGDVHISVTRKQMQWLVTFNLNVDFTSLP